MIEIEARADPGMRLTEAFRRRWMELGQWSEAEHCWTSTYIATARVPLADSGAFLRLIWGK